MTVLVKEEIRHQPVLPIAEGPIRWEVPPRKFLTIDGSGDPGSCRDFWEAMEALYQMAYAVRFISAEHWREDRGLPPLEGLWWNSYLDQERLKVDHDCLWRLLIRQPEGADEAVAVEARRWLEAKGSSPPCERVRLEQFAEGQVFQVDFYGDRDAKLRMLARLHGFIAEQGYEAHEKYHEIYFDSFSLSGQEKMRMIMRQPVRPLNGRPGTARRFDRFAAPRGTGSGRKVDLAAQGAATLPVLG